MYDLWNPGSTAAELKARVNEFKEVVERKFDDSTVAVFRELVSERLRAAGRSADAALAGADRLLVEYVFAVFDTLNRAVDEAEDRGVSADEAAGRLQSVKAAIEALEEFGSVEDVLDCTYRAYHECASADGHDPSIDQVVREFFGPGGIEALEQPASTGRQMQLASERGVGRALKADEQPQGTNNPDGRFYAEFIVEQGMLYEHPNYSFSIRYKNFDTLCIGRTDYSLPYAPWGVWPQLVMDAGTGFLQVRVRMGVHNGTRTIWATWLHDGTEQSNIRLASVLPDEEPLSESNPPEPIAIRIDDTILGSANHPMIRFKAYQYGDGPVEIDFRRLDGRWVKIQPASLPSESKGSWQPVVSPEGIEVARLFFPVEVPKATEKGQVACFLRWS